jgi:deoxycytidylate deaminase
MAGGSNSFLKDERVERAEIVIGLVGALGTDMATVDANIRSALMSVGYRSETVRVSDRIREAVEGRSTNLPDPVTKLDELMDQGDVLRRAVGTGGAAAGLAAMAISAARHQALSGVAGEREALASIIRQLKHPEEVKLLRSIYGPRFILVGAWAPREERERAIRQRLGTHHPGKSEDWYSEQGRRLLDRDEKADDPLGQRVRATFELADAYIAMLPGRDTAPELARLIRLLFGAHYETPTMQEQAMYQAAGARLRSADAGRQVGAVVIDELGELLVTGTNEVPKAGGGQYWVGDIPDHRDFQFGYDGNEREKTALITEILQKLQLNGWLAEERMTTDIEELVHQAMDNGPLSSSRVGDLLEFGRVAHAEMAAICTAARRGTPLAGKIMMSTTYPCHECARLIIAAGLSRVVYIDPYPKSQVPVMYRHEIMDGPSDGDGGKRVVFEPFQGIAPRLYRSVFSMPERTRDDLTGEFIPWDPQVAPPRLWAEAELYFPVQQLEDSLIVSLVPALEAADWDDLEARTA